LLVPDSSGMVVDVGMFVLQRGIGMLLHRGVLAIVIQYASPASGNSWRNWPRSHPPPDPPV